MTNTPQDAEVNSSELENAVGDTPIRHTPEPWEYLDDPPRIVSKSHPDFCIAQYIQEGNARRAIACVDTLRGIPTEELAVLWENIRLCAEPAQHNRNQKRADAANDLLRWCQLHREASQ